MIYVKEHNTGITTWSLFKEDSFMGIISEYNHQYIGHSVKGNAKTLDSYGDIYNWLMEEYNEKEKVC